MDMATERALHKDVTFAEEPYTDASCFVNVVPERAFQNHGCYAEEATHKSYCVTAMIVQKSPPKSLQIEALLRNSHDSAEEPTQEPTHRSSSA